MSDVKRWSVMQGDEMGDFADGEYVRFEDYQNLACRLDSATKLIELAGVECAKRDHSIKLYLDEIEAQVQHRLAAENQRNEATSRLDRVLRVIADNDMWPEAKYIAICSVLEQHEALAELGICGKCGKALDGGCSCVVEKL